MVGIFSKNDRGICGQREVDVRVAHQVGLEFCQTQGSIISEGISNGRHSLANKAVSVSWLFRVKVSLTDVIDGLLVCHEGTTIVPQGGMGGKDGIAEFSNSSGNLEGGTHGKLQLGLLSARATPSAGRWTQSQFPHQSSGKLRSPEDPVHWSASLRIQSKTRSMISLPNGVVATGKVIGRIKGRK